jgi:hypothetical protein
VNPEHLLVYELTCSHCRGTHFVYGWSPKLCIHCGADLGGVSKARLRAKELYYVPVLDQLTGEMAIWPESE